MNIDTDILREIVHDATKQGLKEGLREVLADPATWEAGSDGLQAHAASKAGGFVLSGLRSLFTRVAAVGILLLAIYMVGGWAALVAFIKTGSHTP
jgi:hypothetical protein